MAPRYPAGKCMTLHDQMLDATSFLNLISTAQDGLLRRTDSVRLFALDPEDRANSNSSFAKFKRLMLMMKKNEKSQGRKSRGKKDDGAGWLHLIEAQQHDYHPMLGQLKLAHRCLMEPIRQEDVDDAIPDDMDGQALEQVAEWCLQLEPGDKYLS
ncbi:hypothetical protein F52700_2000 [Fusarium sp. NRRL 52700]|nr:hypothetical protein F52700_2000 [Fusarium sp. NRRL 52700]